MVFVVALLFGARVAIVRAWRRGFHANPVRFGVDAKYWPLSKTPYPPYKSNPCCVKSPADPRQRLRERSSRDERPRLLFPICVNCPSYRTRRGDNLHSPTAPLALPKPSNRHSAVKLALKPCSREARGSTARAALETGRRRATRSTAPDTRAMARATRRPGTRRRAASRRRFARLQKSF